MKLALIFNKSSDGTTGLYLERACRALGIQADHWWLRDAETIPAGYALYLRVDHGNDYELRLPDRLRPAVFYAIDTHLAHSWPKIKHLAAQCDLVFCAQADAARRLRHGVWLPLACDPTLHAAPAPSGAGPAWDVAFIGAGGGIPRKFYLQALRERYSNSVIGSADYRQLGSIYGRARIGFNYAIARDVNMRVFEVLAAGALLVTNALPHDDLARLGLEDRRELILYRSPQELFEVIDDVLAHPEEGRAIAHAGASRVLERHTYVHRMRQLLASVSQRLGVPMPSPNALESHGLTRV